VEEKTFSVTLVPDQINALARALSRTEVYELSDEELEALISVAVRNWIDTLLGPRRFRTMTELYVAWLRDVYTRHLTDEEPNEGRLFTRLGFSYGQSSYIARVLLMEQPLTSRRRSIANLQQALLEAKEKVKDWEKKRLEEERVKLVLSKASHKELDAIMDVLTMRRVDAVHPTRTEGNLGSFRVVLVIAADLEPLLDEVGKLLKLVSAGE